MNAIARRAPRRAVAALSSVLFGLAVLAEPAQAAAPPPMPAVAVVAASVATPASAPVAREALTWRGYLCSRSRYAIPRVRRGSRGYVVGVLQRSLRALRLYTKRIDGWFGPVTYRAVRTFQRRAGIVVDGWVGPQTWGALKWYLC